MANNSKKSTETKGVTAAFGAIGGVVGGVSASIANTFDHSEISTNTTSPQDSEEPLIDASIPMEIEPNNAHEKESDAQPNELEPELTTDIIEPTSEVRTDVNPVLENLEDLAICEPIIDNIEGATAMPISELPNNTEISTNIMPSQNSHETFSPMVALDNENEVHIFAEANLANYSQNEATSSDSAIVSNQQPVTHPIEPDPEQIFDIEVIYAGPNPEYWGSEPIYDECIYAGPNPEDWGGEPIYDPTIDLDPTDPTDPNYEFLDDDIILN